MVHFLIVVGGIGMYLARHYFIFVPTGVHFSSTVNNGALLRLPSYFKDYTYSYSYIFSKWANSSSPRNCYRRYTYRMKTDSNWATVEATTTLKRTPRGEARRGEPRPTLLENVNPDQSHLRCAGGQTKLHFWHFHRRDNKI